MRRAWVSLIAVLGCHGAVEPKTAQPGPAVEAEGDDELVVGSGRVEAAPGATLAERLVAEATRELHAMKSTRYRHKTHVDEPSGLFEYDCSGFVAYALQKVSPAAFAAIPVGSKGRPKAEHFATYFSGLTGDGPWLRVARGSELRPGDVVAWLKPAEIDSTNTGHIAILVEAPKKIAASEPVTAIGGAAEWVVRVIDSTQSPHEADLRSESATGLGSGILGIVVDGADTPIGYRWKGGRSPRAWATMIAIGRLR
ncbi:MAG: hypothetical protein ACXVEF_16645 [Polyangiales bacterium]